MTIKRLNIQAITDQVIIQLNWLRKNVLGVDDEFSDDEDYDDIQTIYPNAGISTRGARPDYAESIADSAPYCDELTDNKYLQKVSVQNDPAYSWSPWVTKQSLRFQTNF